MFRAAIFFPRSRTRPKGNDNFVSDEHFRNTWRQKIVFEIIFNCFISCFMVPFSLVMTNISFYSSILPKFKSTFHCAVFFMPYPSKIQIHISRWHTFFIPAHERGLKQAGSFQCLNGKVALSTHEAQHTLAAWQDQYGRLKKKRSVRAIAKEIAAAACPRTVKTLVYKNGEGRSRKGEVIYASSVNGVRIADFTSKRALILLARTQ